MDLFKLAARICIAASCVAALLCRLAVDAVGVKLRNISFHTFEEATG
jgi:hypothetical protein